MTIMCKKCKQKYFDQAGRSFANCPECGGDFEKVIDCSKCDDSGSYLFKLDENNKRLYKVCECKAGDKLQLELDKQKG